MDGQTIENCIFHLNDFNPWNVIERLIECYLLLRICLGILS